MKKGGQKGQENALSIMLGSIRDLMAVVDVVRINLFPRLSGPSYPLTL